MMKALAMLPALMLCSCAAPETRRKAAAAEATANATAGATGNPAANPAAEAWYRQTTAELAGMNRDARVLFAKGRKDEAAALIVKGEELSKRLLGVREPTLEATAAASDVDELFGQMLFSNRNYGWARLLFQKNVARWKYRRPQTPETEARMRQAQEEIEQCDREIGK